MKRWLILLLLILLAGCSDTGGRAKPLAFSYRTDAAIASIRRILVVPFARSEKVGTAAKALDEAMASAWRELGRFEVLVCDDTERDRLLKGDAVARGTLTSDELRAVHRAFSVDAVLIGRVEQFGSYDPVAAGVQATLISCLDGSVPWTATGHFDSGRKDVQADIQRWYRDTIGKGRSELSGWQAVLSSPRLFSRYLSDRLAASVLWNRPQEPGHLQAGRPRPR